MSSNDVTVFFLFAWNKFDCRPVLNPDQYMGRKKEIKAVKTDTCVVIYHSFLIFQFSLAFLMSTGGHLITYFGLYFLK